jgi:hypothetical protein
MIKTIDRSEKLNAWPVWKEQGATHLFWFQTKLESVLKKGDSRFDITLLNKQTILGMKSPGT